MAEDSLKQLLESLDPDDSLEKAEFTGMSITHCREIQHFQLIHLDLRSIRDPSG